MGDAKWEPRDIEKLAHEVKDNLHDPVGLRALGASIVARYGRATLREVVDRASEILIFDAQSRRPKLQKFFGIEGIESWPAPQVEDDLGEIWRDACVMRKRTKRNPVINWEDAKQAVKRGPKT
jgi:hypothetical protein